MEFGTTEILQARSAKNLVDPRRPYAYLVEDECTADGAVESVATIFLTNRECPFRCLMCDLWQNTTDETVPVGAIPEQIEFALSRLPPAKHIKLYNSGNFFDPRAIPPADYDTILSQVKSFDSVIVENHPRFCNDACLQFGRQVAGEFEVAIGLETMHPQVLPMLNKQMTTGDFTEAVAKLKRVGIHSRAFILLKPPSMNEIDGIVWAVRSAKFAFGFGVRCCSIIPTRGGNGIMERAAEKGVFEPPKLRSMELVLAELIRLGRGRVFMDLWDAGKFSECEHCCGDRIERMQQMNLQQVVIPEVACDHC